MIDAESYGVSGRQLLSSKHVPASGRVCSCRKPSVWPSSWPRMLLGVHDPEVQIESSTSTLRERLGELGKNARAMYWEVCTGSTEKSTLVLRVVQLASWDGTYTKLILEDAASHRPAPPFIALTMSAFRAPNLSLTQ